MKWLPIRNIFIYLCLIYMGGNGGMKGWKERGRVKGASAGERSVHSRSPSFWLVKTSINWVCGSVSLHSATRASASPGCSEIWSLWGENLAKVRSDKSNSRNSDCFTNMFLKCSHVAPMLPCSVTLLTRGYCQPYISTLETSRFQNWPRSQSILDKTVPAEVNSQN